MRCFLRTNIYASKSSGVLLGGLVHVRCGFFDFPTFFLIFLFFVFDLYYSDISASRLRQEKPRKCVHGTVDSWIELHGVGLGFYDDFIYHSPFC